MLVTEMELELKNLSNRFSLRATFSNLNDNIRRYKLISKNQIQDQKNQIHLADAYSEPSQTCTIIFFAQIVNY